jgi:hypothetical protein
VDPPIAGLLTLGTAEGWVRRGPMRLRAFRDWIAEAQARYRLDPGLRDFRRRGDRPSPAESGKGLGSLPSLVCRGGQAGNGLALAASVTVVQ